MPHATFSLGRLIRGLFAVLPAMLPLALTTLAMAACPDVVATRWSPRFVPVAYRALAAVPPGYVSITFVGHASFLIETTQGATIVTDYNGYNRPNFAPDIVTMNNAHSTHYTDIIEPGIKHALRGWDPSGGMALHNLRYLDVLVRNVPTNVRDYGGTRYNGNSIFVFETANLCIAHLSHLHHTLTDVHLKELGEIDVLMVPVDGGYTLGHAAMLEVMAQIKAPLVIPMHWFSGASLQRFVAQAKDRYVINVHPSDQIVLSRASLPKEPEILVMPDRAGPARLD